MDIISNSVEDKEVVKIIGRIDSYTAPSLADKLNEINSRNRYKIILDLTDVNFVSSAGLRVFIDIQKTCKKFMGEVLLVNVPSRVYDTLELAGFAPLFKFYPNVSSAIDAKGT
jgi:anti-sigma B factor antagonist